MTANNLIEFSYIFCELMLEGEFLIFVSVAWGTFDV